MKLLLIRHGRTDKNGTGFMHKIHDPIGLNEIGKQQALGLISLIQKHQAEIVYSSPEKRAIETAEIISSSFHIPITVNENIGERNFGELQILPYKEIKAKLNSLSLEERYQFKPPRGESWKEMDDRLSLFLEEIKNKHFSSIAIITHEGVLRALVTLLQKDPKEKNLDLHFDNGSLTVLEV